MSCGALILLPGAVAAFMLLIVLLALFYEWRAGNLFRLPLRAYICVPILMWWLASGVTQCLVWARADLLGGQATNGMVEGNHYFVGNHGHYREVPQQTYVRQLTWEKWTGRSGSASLVAMLGMFIYLKVRKVDAGDTTSVSTSPQIPSNSANADS
jgi:hypothetical protein